MALDFIGVGERCGEEGADLLLRRSWLGAIPLSQSCGYGALCSVALAGEAGDLRQQSAVVITVTCNQIIMQTGHHANTSQ
ncbi:hypothetical protein AHGSH82_012980 [Aeromonas hydrophila]|nr:hypothetical protein AHGSH82_012980 [Aeromonas hydrophila]BBT61486.1 hypothetical protein WP8S18E02_12830 [Aeromonas hydrophila]